MKKRLERIRQKIDEVDNWERPVGNKNIAIFIIVGVMIAGLLAFGGGITGLMTFSEDTISNDPNNFIVEQTRTVLIEPQEGAQTFLMSGEVKGDGVAKVFLLDGEKKYLVYYYEGAEGEKFTDACYGSCYTEPLSRDAKLLFELDGVEVTVTNIKYVAPRLIGFELSPKELVIDYKKTPAVSFDVTVLNNYEKNFDLVLFVDGPLADSFSWQGGLVRFLGEKEKTIRMSLILPDELPPGDYPNKITARYVPPEGKNFMGSAPSEEMIVTVKN